MWLLLLTALLAIVLWKTYPGIGHLILRCRETWLLKRAGCRKVTYHINGVPVVCYDNKQRKPLLLLLHGLTADKSVWLAMLADLGQHFRVVVPDLLGHGETRYSKAYRYDVQSQAQIVNALIWHVGTTKAHIMGSSMGGHIAAYLASTYPQTIKSCTLLSPAGRPAPVPSEMDRLLKRNINPFLVHGRRGYYKLLGMAMAKPPYLPFPVKDALCALHIEKTPAFEHVMHDYLKGGNLSYQHVARISCPTLVVWGDKDDIIDSSALDQWRLAFTCVNSTQSFHDVGHLPMVESPRRVFYTFMHFYEHCCLKTPTSTSPSGHSKQNAG